MGILASISTGLKALLVFLGIIKGVQEDFRDEKKEQDGKNAVAAEQLESLGEERKEYEDIKADVADDSRAELDKRADKWMRPK